MKRGILTLCIAVLLPSAASSAAATVLTASWYSVESLKREGTFKTSSGIMANGQKFDENALTCANRLFPLGTLVRVTNESNGKSVIVRTTDRIGKRFANTRIDLSKAAFAQICDLKKGITKVTVEPLSK